LGRNARDRTILFLWCSSVFFYLGLCTEFWGERVGYLGSGVGDCGEAGFRGYVEAAASFYSFVGLFGEDGADEALDRVAFFFGGGYTDVVGAAVGLTVGELVRIVRPNLLPTSVGNPFNASDVTPKYWPFFVRAVPSCASKGAPHATAFPGANSSQNSGS